MILFAKISNIKQKVGFVITYDFFVVGEQFFNFVVPKLYVSKRVFVGHVVSDANHVNIKPLEC